jgi:Flp pilus assembly pilin Flp
MSEILRRFVRSTGATTSIEYALVSMSVGMVIVLAVNDFAVSLSALYNHIVAALP